MKLSRLIAVALVPFSLALNAYAQGDNSPVDDAGDISREQEPESDIKADAFQDVSDTDDEEVEAPKPKAVIHSAAATPRPAKPMPPAANAPAPAENEDEEIPESEPVEETAPVAKPAVQKPVAKPAVQQQAPAVQQAPAAVQQAPAPVAKPAAQQAPAVKPAAQPAPVAKPAVQPAPVAKPAVQPAPVAKPVVQQAPVAKPVAPQAPVAKPTTIPQAPAVAPAAVTKPAPALPITNKIQAAPATDVIQTRKSPRAAEMGLTTTQTDAITSIRKASNMDFEKKLEAELKQVKAELNAAMVDASPGENVRKKFDLMQKKTLELQKLKFERALKIRDVLTVEQRKKLNTYKNSH